MSWKNWAGGRGVGTRAPDPRGHFAPEAIWSSFSAMHLADRCATEGHSTVESLGSVSCLHYIATAAVSQPFRHDIRTWQTPRDNAQQQEPRWPQSLGKNPATASVRNCVEINLTTKYAMIVANYACSKQNWLACGCSFRCLAFLSASLYVSKRGAYWDRLCRDVVGRWLVGCHARALWPNGAS